MIAAESRAKELQEELTGVYKEKSKLAEELVAASRQLQIVRDSNEAQARELDDLAAKGREMRARIKELSDALEKEKDATRLATSEMQVQHLIIAGVAPEQKMTLTLVVKAVIEHNEIASFNEHISIVSGFLPAQARLDEKEAAEKRADKLEKETADLSKRLVDLKMSEAERMNEVRCCYPLNLYTAVIVALQNACWRSKGESLLVQRHGQEWSP